MEELEHTKTYIDNPSTRHLWHGISEEHQVKMATKHRLPDKEEEGENNTAGERTEEEIPTAIPADEDAQHETTGEENEGAKRRSKIKILCQNTLRVLSNELPIVLFIS